MAIEDEGVDIAPRLLALAVAQAVALGNAELDPKPVDPRARTRAPGEFPANPTGAYTPAEVAVFEHRLFLQTFERGIALPGGCPKRASQDGGSRRRPGGGAENQLTLYPFV